MGMVEPCLGVTEDGELIMLENEAIVKDGRKQVAPFVADFGDSDDITSVCVILICAKV